MSFTYNVFNFLLNFYQPRWRRVEFCRKSFGRVEKNHQRVEDGLVNVRTVSCDLTIGTYTFNMKGLKQYKLIHQIKIKTLKVPNFHILLKIQPHSFFIFLFQSQILDA
jgi:hypothetical protein